MKKAFLGLALVLVSACGSDLRDQFCSDAPDVASARAAIVFGEYATDDRSTVQIGGCTAIKIADNIFISAAHCGDQTGNTVMSAFGGGATVVDTLIHPDYDPASPDHDIAIVFTSFTLVHVPSAPIGIPTTGSALIQGFGVDENHKSGYLREGWIDIEGFDGNKIHSTLKAERSTDTCYGDSGGPVYQGGYVVGITSHGVYGADTGDRVYDACGYGGVYTAIAGYVDWIQAETGISGQGC